MHRLTYDIVEELPGVPAGNRAARARRAARREVADGAEVLAHRGDAPRIAAQ